MKFESINNKLITSLLLLTIITSFLFNNFVWCENIIKIIPGASKYDSKNPFSVTRFFDTTFFPITPNQNITWYNEDRVIHQLYIINNQHPEIKIDSEPIEPKKSFSMSFNNSGTYNYSSATYPYMKGYIVVDDKVLSKKHDAIKNNKEIQISYLSNYTTKGDEKNPSILLIFTDRNTNKNSEHIDYSVTVNNSKGNILYKQSMHSLWGTELISFKIDTKESYNIYPLKVKIMINGIFFQPVDPDGVEFDITN